MRYYNVGALIIRIGFWGVQVIIYRPMASGLMEGHPLKMEMSRFGVACKNPAGGCQLTLL